MRIGIDARFFGPIGKGLGRYTEKLIENLEQVDQINQYFIFLKKENFDAYQPKNKRFHKVLADYRWYTFSEQIKIPRLLNKYNLDLVHFPHFNVPIFYRKPFVITIHDLILLHFPTVRGTTLSPIFYWLKFFAYKLVIGLAIQRTKKIITVSNFTKRDIVENYRISPEKVAVTYEACENFCGLPGKNEKNIFKKYGLFSEKYGKINSYMMYVGNAYPHKNLERLILAFEKVFHSDQKLHLVLIGKKDFFYERLRKLVDERKIKNVVFAGFVPDKELDVFYHQALVYVFPSLYEGFGLPPLEAMDKGTPVISSDHSCMREILGDSAYFFNGKDVNKIAKALIKVTQDEELRAKLIKKGYEQIKKYSWKKMAEETLKIYEN